MPIPVRCACGKTLKVNDALAGKSVKCPGCGKPLAIPSPAKGPFRIHEEEDFLLIAASLKAKTGGVGLLDAFSGTVSAVADVIDSLTEKEPFTIKPLLRSGGKWYLARAEFLSDEELALVPLWGKTVG